MSTTADRIKQMMEDLEVDQPGLGRLAGASKAMVNHWCTGHVKVVAAKYAYPLQRKTGYSAEWIQLGAGPKKLADAVQETSAQALPADAVAVANDWMKCSKRARTKLSALIALVVETEKIASELQNLNSDKDLHQSTGLQRKL